MTLLIIGLVIFLGIHSLRMFAGEWRAAQIARRGALGWKGLFSIVSVIGLALIIWGYAQARQDPQVLWNPPVAMRHVAALLTLGAFILLAATYVPRNSIKARVHHPMVLGVTVWAFAHLLSNGALADLILFGSFLIWAKLSFLMDRKRDRMDGTQYPAGTMAGTLTTLAVGIAAWALFAFWLHEVLIGVRPFA